MRTVVGAAVRDDAAVRTGLVGRRNGTGLCDWSRWCGPRQIVKVSGTYNNPAKVFPGRMPVQVLYGAALFIFKKASRDEKPVVYVHNRSAGYAISAGTLLNSSCFRWKYGDSTISWIFAT
ncbi:hypothetical protein R70331_19860 [Paenibacillus sp. FSL R7-0331]|nr:hypothetical protein R70331_19860 [Paenibacillus sp. FSL R7-0331]